MLISGSFLLTIFGQFVQAVLVMWGVELQNVVLVSAVKVRVELSHVRNDNNIDGCEIRFTIVNKTRVLLQLQCLAGSQLSRGHTTIERTQRVFT